MPPRGEPRGRGQGGGAGPRGAAPSRGRGGAAPRGRGRGAASAPAGIQVGTTQQAGHVETVGVKRPGVGRAGRGTRVMTNHFPVSIPKDIIYHYDEISPSEKKLPARMNMDIITSLQRTKAPEVFTPPAVYDGRKNLFANRRLSFPVSPDFPDTRDSCSFDVAIDNPNRPAETTTGRPPKTFKVTLKKVAEINPEVLARFLAGIQSNDNTVLTAITALNVVVRMEPTQKYPFNVRSFFTPSEKRNIGGGLVLWRGYFQSIRPAPGGMLVNIDISTGAMFRDGPLIGLALEFLGQPGSNVRALARRERGGALDEAQRVRLQRFVSGIRIQTIDKNGQPSGTPRVVKKISAMGAQDLSFTLREGGTKTVAQYFHETRNKALTFVHLICAEVGQGALIPFELCHVPPGQILRRQVPQDKTKEVVEFATKKPQERLASIRAGLDVLSYGQSEYLRSFGMGVDVSQGPLKISARILQPPMLRYGVGSKQPTVTPRDGAWNMIDKRFWRASTIEEWGLVVYERENRFDQRSAHQLIENFVMCCGTVGVTVKNTSPQVFYVNAQLSVGAELMKVGMAIKQRSGKLPTLLVCVLPEGATDLYTAIKHFGDIKTGVATQCLKSIKCRNAKMQYFANVLLKVNVKLGGVNTVPDPKSVAILTDSTNPTCVMGADVIHPAPGSEGRPSFTALVNNVDSDTAKYVSSIKVQTSRQEMIDDLEEMAKSALTQYMSYRKVVEKVQTTAPKRIIFYRDGVSEGQFKQVIELELPRIKAACKSLNINPKITVIVVGKRHHVRFFPEAGQGDRSGNCHAGTVVDTDVVNPIEFDFYLQSHAGLLGTSRPSHYNVLYDENNFTPDGLQTLSFALCHVYARSTRSVSIPAPVYYADIVCSRAKNHYDPEDQRRLQFSESGETEDTAAESTLERYRAGFMPLAATTARNMYFS